MGVARQLRRGRRSRNGASFRNRGVGWFGCVIGVVTVSCVFVLPFFVPTPLVRTISASYVAGFNNRVAIVAAAACSVAVLLWSWRRARGEAGPARPEDDPDAKLSILFTAGVVTATWVFVAIAGWLVAQSHLRYIADVGYFIEQMSAHVDYGRSLYTGLEFAYGPLLFYPTVVLHKLLFSSWFGAYFVTLALDQALGLVLLAFVLNELPIGGRDRKIGFVLLAIGALNPLLGLNYTFFRFVTPFATLLLATRSGGIWQTTALLAAGEMIQLGISPEMGLAFLVGTMTFSGLRAWKDGWRWLLVVTAPFLGVCILLLIAGRSYLRMLQSFSRGALNLPVAPYPHIVIFLFALVWLVPMALGPMLREGRLRGSRILACYGLAIALLPAALGRCDPLHVFFNGAGLLMLSLVAIRFQPRYWRVAWIAALVSFVLWLQWVNTTLYLDRTADTLRVALMPRLPDGLRGSLISVVGRINPDVAEALRPTEKDADYRLDVPGLEQEAGTALVATPLEISPAVEAALKRSHRYDSGYYAFFVDVLNASGEASKIRDLNRAEWALIPAEPEDPFIETPKDIDGVQGFAFPYPQRNPIPYDLGSAFSDNLETEWIVKRKFGPYLLYQHSPAERH